MKKQRSYQVHLSPHPYVAIIRNAYRPNKTTRTYDNISTTSMVRLIFALRNTHTIYAHVNGWSAQPDRIL